MKKSIIITLVIICIVTMNYAQTIKNYSGTYSLNGTKIANGKAEYSYYLKDNNEVRQGTFTLTTETSNYPTMKIDVGGTYKDNLKNGEWTSKVNIEPFGSEVQMKLISNYSNGYPDGLWTYTLSAKENKKVVATQKLTATFSKGTIIKDFTYTETSNEKNVSYVAKFDTSGYFVSEVNRVNQVEKSKKFVNGVMITDEFTQAKIEEITKKIAYYNLNYPDSLNEYQYRIEEFRLELPYETNNFLFFKFYLYNDVRGDILFKGLNNRDEVIYEYNGFKYKEIKKQETITDRFNIEIKNADLKFKNADYAAAINIYNSALKMKPNSDYALAQMKLCYTKIKEMEEQKLIKDKTIQADKYFENKNFENAKTVYNEILKIKPENEYAKSQIELCDKNAIEAEYNKYVDAGDVEFKNKNYKDAVISYNQALTIKADDETAKNKLKQAKNKKNATKVKSVFLSTILVAGAAVYYYIKLI